MEPQKPTAASAKETQTKTPQQMINDFWDNFIIKSPSKVASIFPHSLYANLLPPKRTKDGTVDRNAVESYEAAAEECRKKVQNIVSECQRTNEKFTDTNFDIEADLGCGNCLHGLLPLEPNAATAGEPTASVSVSASELKKCLDMLVASQILGPESAAVLSLKAVQEWLSNDEKDDTAPDPQAVHRVDYIYEKPAFFIDGYSTNDVQQGAADDCWWVSAVATLCSKKGLLDRVCIARNDECGVYGFVFHRDGEWISTVVDDNLYLSHPDYSSSIYDSTGEREHDYKKLAQTGSRAIHFAHCKNKNETWLPLLEKAYAKVHGDYDAISGGISGEAVEDMTGGVTTSLATNKVLSREKLWQELCQANENFVFAASSPWLGPDIKAARGLALNHAYSVLRATEESDEDGKKVRLVLIRNCWGRRDYMGVGEWSGPWSDGSKEWTPYWMEKLNYRFGDDGVFWMSYDDVLRYFQTLDRTRLFDKEWTIVQQWTSVNISWVTGYLNTKFLVEIKKPGPVVFVLSQLDTRYFVGLEGQYYFELHFLLQREDAPAGEHIASARGSDSGGGRSVSAELDLEPGRYEVMPKIQAFRDADKATVEDVVKNWAEKKPQKLRQIGLNYDLAHAKVFYETKQKKSENKAKEGPKKHPEPDKKEHPEGHKKEQPEGDKKQQQEGDEEQPAGRKDASSGTPIGTTSDPSDASTTVVTPATSTPDAQATIQASEAPYDGENAQVSEAPHDDENAQASSSDLKSGPWNAVCVIGLRVYSKDAEASIKLMSPRDVEEGASLDVDGTTPAGATM